MSTRAWRCGAHGITTTGDCPQCDDELTALTHPECPVAHCRLCGRIIRDGESAWASDWTVFDADGARAEVRYTCDECHAADMSAA